MVDVPLKMSKWMGENECAPAGQMPLNIPVKMVLLGEFWLYRLHNKTQTATWCMLLGTTLMSLPLLYCMCTRVGRSMKRIHNEITHRKKCRSAECWAEYLFLLVLALGAMSGVRTYRLLFLGRCKLLSTI